MLKKSFYFLSLFIFTMGLAACGSKGHDQDHDHEDETEQHAGEAGDDHDHGDEIILTPEKARAAGVKVETIMPGTFHGVIHTSGKVLSASCDETTVVATISGRVSYKNHVSEGLKVAGGMQLFSITSAGMQVADGDPVQRARIDYERAERDYTRARLLIKDKIISEKDLAVAKAEYEAARLTYTSVQKTRSAGGVVVTAPRGGYVKQCLVAGGDYVEAGQPLAVITQNKHLYLRAEIPEREFKELNKIRCAKFRTSYSDRLYDITDMGGHIQSYGRSAEVNNSYIPVVFEFNNTGDVVQGSYAEIYLITQERENVLTLPLTALTEEQGVHYIYIQVDKEGYRKQEVTLGESDGERVEILSGLKKGDKVVTKGAIQVKLASAANAIPAHNHNH
ncbi:efflux RND transporter periplasmic adaptor subunit [uncultured Prevotella sp.]|uniref:efflux RND transporter periplasmic adaptor subunit n=1 Tax=uncultured Prevotella sp. TaxID=159272 RepID=UPI00260D421E|nr:efflux RND transporter periplasmic adaptor subunit [uncultured Prevotella sp.]